MRLYPDPTAGDLVHALAEYYGVKDEQVFVGVGSDDVLAMCFLTFFNSEKPILFPDITYSFYKVWAELYRIPYECPKVDEKFRIVKEDYYKENGGACWLYKAHTVFGQVIEGYDVLDEVAAVKTNSQGKPEKDVIIESIDFDVY